ncbi:CYTH domain-containing protein, partial [Patescibacteria group bacterium]|nr:CYTH domain-containing protein [Patescibacteria group bacterium]
MYEIEAKVAISKPDFKRLQKELGKVAKFKGKSLKKDTYYDNPKKVFFRIRNEGRKNYLIIKEKGIEKGVEANLEMEWGIKDLNKFNKLLKKIG